MKYIEYVRGAIPLHTLGPVLRGVPRYSKELIGKQYAALIYIIENDKLYWINPKEELYSVARYLFKILKDKKKRRKHFELYYKLGNRIKEYVSRVIENNLKSADINKLLDIYKKLDNNFQMFYALALEIDSFDAVSEDIFKKRLSSLIEKKIGKDYKEGLMTKELGILTTPTKQSYVTKESAHLHKIAGYAKKQGIRKIRINSEDRVVNSMLDELEADFWWTGLSWEGGDVKTRKDFVQKANEILKEKGSLFVKLKKIKSWADRVKKEKNELMERYDFDDEFKYLIGLFEDYIELHDYRKEISVKNTLAFNLLLNEFARRKKIDVRYLQWMWQDEVMTFMEKGSINKKKIEKRFERVFVRSHPAQTFEGDTAIRYINKFIKNEDKVIEDFSGLSASHGKVIGKVKVCINSKEAVKKIKKGNILVTGMTTPDYLPAMQKAAAIVTGEGGITCHAAIISREFGIPCIVGTKIATKVLKDGDLIEVNANQGVVKIIKKNKGE